MSRTSSEYSARVDQRNRRVDAGRVGSVERAERREFEGGDPEPHPLPAIEMGEREFRIDDRRDWIANLVVLTAIGMIPMSLLAIALGIPAQDVALVAGASSAPELALIGGVVSHYFRR